MKYLIIADEQGRVKMKVEYYPELEDAVQSELRRKQKEVQDDDS